MTGSLALKKSRVFWFGGMLMAAARAGLGQTTFTNPIAPSGADPFVVLYNGNYYYTDTTGNNVSVAEASTVPGIGTAAMNAVYTPPNGEGNVWAPELQQIGGTWYIYFAMGPSGNTNNQRTYVLQDTTSSPLGPYSYAGQINDPTNLWAIDPTVLNSGGSNYLIWSGWAGINNVAQNLYIAPMTSPTTLGNRVLISSPSNSWEQQGGPPSVNEGPVVLTSPAGTTTVIFSASGSWTDNYCLGQLELTGSNPLSAASWTKDNAGPVFASANNVFGPGHSSYTTSDNGTRNWIVYHAADYSGAGWTRDIRTQPFSWNPDGTPSFGQPVPVTVPIQWGPTSWIGAINESSNDTVHSYLNSANWVNGNINDSFANVTLTDNTTLYFNANHTTAGNMVFSYGSGQKTLTLESSSSSNQILTLTGAVEANMLGGTNSLYFGSVTNPMTVAMGSNQTNFNISAGNSVYMDASLTGTAGLNVSGGGVLVLRGQKTYSGPTLISNGVLDAGDGGLPSSTTNLPPGTVVTIGTAGTLQLNGISSSTANTETIGGLGGAGNVNGPGDTDSLTITNSVPYTFSGSITGPNLSVVQAGPSTQTLSGSSLYRGSTIVTGGTLNLTGSENGTSNLFVKQGSATIAAGGSLTTTSYVSIGQSAGDNGTLTVTGSLNVPGDLNIGDVSATGVMYIASGASVACTTLSVGKYVTSNGTVVQTGGAVTALGNGGDWRIGGSGSAGDSAAVGLYNLSGGSLNTGTSNFQIGAYGTGTLVQSAGTVTSGGYVSIGRFPGGAGYYNISGGSLIATGQPYLIVGEQGAGTLNVSGNGAVNALTLSVGHNGGAGTVNQSGGVVSASAGLLLGRSGAGTYLLSGGQLYTASVLVGAGNGVFDFNGGVLLPTASSATFMQGLSTATVQMHGAIFNTSGFIITVNQPLLHDPTVTGTDGGLTKLGSGTLTIGGLETYNGNTTVTGGTLAFAANTTASIIDRPVGALSVATAATLVAGATVPTAGVANTLLVAQGSVNSSGTINLGINDLDVKNGSLVAIDSLVRQGYGNGTWAGTGITSSAAAASGLHLTALGSIQNSTGNNPIYTTFDGEPVSGADVLVKYTYYGDSNLDGKVDGGDYSLVDNGYLNQLTGWFNGDFNYDNIVNGSDYTLIDNTFNRQGAQITSEFASPEGLPASPVPEPSGAAFVALSLSGLLGRRFRSV